MAFVANGGINLHYECTGSGPPIIFVHTWLTTSLFWKDQVSELRRHHQVITVDLRGHGDSSKPKGAYTASILTRDISRIVDALRLRQVVLVGWGFGGLVTLGYVHQLPSQVRGLVLVGVNAKPVADDEYQHGVSEEESRQALKDLDQDYRRFLRDYSSRLFRSDSKPELISWANAEASKTSSHAARALAEVILEADETDLLSEVNLPTLICHGKHDQITLLGAAEYLTEALPKSKLKVFEESGHALQIEQAAQFNQELALFVKSLG